MRLKDILQINGPNDRPITLRQIHTLDTANDYRPLLKEIQKSGEGHIIIECHPDRIIDILKQADEVKMMGEYQSYILTSLNAHTIDFDEIRTFSSNITSLRLFDTTSHELKASVNDWELREKQNDKTFHISPDHITTESILMYDGVNIFASALRELHLENNITVEPYTCKNTPKWEYGRDLVNHMKEKRETGVTGPIMFDESGNRNHFQIHVMELSSKKGLRKIAIWDPSSGINYTRTMSEVLSEIEDSLHSKTFTIVSRIGAPFLMMKKPEDGEKLEGNDRFEGYSIDLIDGISKILGFKYIFELVPDGKYGSYNKITKNWDGLVRHLLDRVS